MSVGNECAPAFRLGFAIGLVVGVMLAVAVLMSSCAAPAQADGDLHGPDPAPITFIASKTIGKTRLRLCGGEDCCKNANAPCLTASSLRLLVREVRKLGGQRKPRDKHCFDVKCRTFETDATCSMCPPESGDDWWCSGLPGSLSCIGSKKLRVCDTFCARGRLEKR